MSKKGSKIISNSKNVLGSISCVKTVTNRKNESENQDSCSIAENSESNIKAIIIADGLGSFECADKASEIVVRSVKKELEDIELNQTLENEEFVFEEINFPAIFQNVKNELIEYAKTFELENNVTLDKEKSFGTTLIIALEDDQHITFAYVGNGAIWHIRGNFNHFHRTKYLPWNGLNYLNPHSALYTTKNENSKIMNLKLPYFRAFCKRHFQPF